MEESQGPANCQIENLPVMFERYAPIPPESLPRRLRLAVRRRLNARQVRSFKTMSSRWFDNVLSFLGRKRQEPVAIHDPYTSAFRPGDMVRVRSREEIQATLNHWGQLKGCMFMPAEMSPYCGTVQRVFKPMERFVDERDYHVKKASGIILLEGLHCKGTSDYGRCDRSCFYFWREEWLEKIESQAATPPAAK